MQSTVCFSSDSGLARFDVFVGLFRSHLRKLDNGLKNGRLDFTRFDRLGNIRAAVESDNDDIALASRFQCRVGA